MGYRSPGGPAGLAARGAELGQSSCPSPVGRAGGDTAALTPTPACFWGPTTPGDEAGGQKPRGCPITLLSSLIMACGLRDDPPRHGPHFWLGKQPPTHGQWGAGGAGGPSAPSACLGARPGPEFLRSRRGLFLPERKTTCDHAMERVLQTEGVGFASPNVDLTRPAERSLLPPCQTAALPTLTNEKFC